MNYRVLLIKLFLLMFWNHSTTGNTWLKLDVFNPFHANMPFLYALKRPGVKWVNPFCTNFSLYFNVSSIQQKAWKLWNKGKYIYETA